MKKKQKMQNGQKDAFWKAAVLTAVIFFAGVLLGYLIEKNRAAKIEEQFAETEIEWADAKLQSLYYQMISPEWCDSAIEENINFADKVYEQGLRLEEYEEANQITEKLLFEKKKYALLKAEFWINSISLKEKCNATYKNLVYFYTNEPSLKEEQEQNIQSIVLMNLKEKYGNSIMLIPLPIDLDISVIEVMKDTYDIKTSPTIIIDEEIKLEGRQSAEEIEKYLQYEA